MRLVDAQSGTLIWSDQYDTDADQLIAVQDDIVRHVAGSLAVRITNVEQARLWRGRPPAWKPTISCCAAAICRRASHAPRPPMRAWPLNGRSSSTPTTRRAMWGSAAPTWSPSTTAGRPIPPAPCGAPWPFAQGDGIDEFNPAAQALLGRIHTRLGEYDRALETLRHALELDPSDPETHAGLGDALLWNGETDEARQIWSSQPASIRSCPARSSSISARPISCSGSTSNAAQVFERAVARQDGNPFIHAMLAAIYAEAGRREAGCARSAKSDGGSPLFDLNEFGTLFMNPTHRERSSRPCSRPECRRKKAPRRARLAKPPPLSPEQPHDTTPLPGMTGVT